jgi:putative FmdB family regulatory protein
LPLYEYRCQKCGASIEKIQKFSDAPLVKCEKCGGRLERVLSAPAIQFKGSGWYVNDYGRGSSSAASKPKSDGDGSSSEKKKEAPAAGKSETTPASKK